jgi:hypothetical protein
MIKERYENTKLSTTLILADNSWRSSKFRTRTVLIEESGKKVVQKIAVTKEAQAFLKTIATRERANAVYLKKHFDVLYGDFKGNYIKYKYIPYESLNQKIASELREKHYDKANELLALYVQKVNALNKLYICPKEFISMVTLEPSENYKLELDCLSRGLLDLTPRNILLDGNRWVVVDNEWSFDFPVPAIFILFRAIVEIVVGLQQEIRRCTKKTHPAVGIFSRRLRTYYFPEDWVKYISDTTVSFEQMLRWESGFRQYIAGFSEDTIGCIKTRPRIRTYFLACRLGNNIANPARASQFLKNLPIIRWLIYSFEHMLLRLKK